VQGQEVILYSVDMWTVHLSARGREKMYIYIWIFLRKRLTHAHAVDTRPSLPSSLRTRLGQCPMSVVYSDNMASASSTNI
jgi:hypothetical protein